MKKFYKDCFRTMTFEEFKHTLSDYKRNDYINFLTDLVEFGNVINEKGGGYSLMLKEKMMKNDYINKALKDAVIYDEIESLRPELEEVIEKYNI